MARFVKISTFQECIKAGQAHCIGVPRTHRLLTVYSLFTNLEQSVKKWPTNAAFEPPAAWVSLFHGASKIPVGGFFALDPRPRRVYNSAYSFLHSREKYRYADQNGF